MWMHRKRMKNTDFCCKELVFCKISQPITLKRENSKQEKFLNHLISEVMVVLSPTCV